MTNPTSSDPTFPQGGVPQGQPGGGTPPPPPAGYATPGYAPASAYAGAAPAGQLGMAEAVRSVLSQYATFSGRARRSEYWWFVLASVIASVVASIVDTALGVSILSLLLSLGLLIPSLALGVRRLHDIGKSGWWILIGLIPLVGVIVLIVFACQDSEPGTNQWGPSPKYGASPDA
jgi:uncharacterized membrane protein YhaH (DUF805 family)